MCLDRVGSDGVVKKRAHLPHLQRLLRTDQGGFQYALCLSGIHGLRDSGSGTNKGAAMPVNLGRTGRSSVCGA
jgi:hypothetical protein